MSMITVDLRDRKQLYEQIIDNIKELVLVGEIKTDEMLPSVRSLAKEIGINPNTIQKAYTELERDGIISTYPGRGSIVVAGRETLRDEASKKLIEKMTGLAAEMKKIGFDESGFTQAALIGWRNNEENGGENI